MDDNKLICPHCNQKIDLDEVLIKQISQQSIDEAKSLERDRLKAEFKLKLEESQKDLSSVSDKNRQLAQDYADLRDEMRQVREERDSQRKILDQEYEQKLSLEKKRLRNQIREDAFKENRLKDLEKDKKLNDALNQVRDLQNKLKKTQSDLEQNRGQLQGEVLEIDIEEKLKQSFPMDKISEVKKFHRGADIHQVVINQSGEECGLIVWEIKNAKWNKNWIDKFKQDIRSAKAGLGILVSREMPHNSSDMIEIEPRIWVTKPSMAVSLAVAVRTTLIEVHRAQNNNNLKDEQMQHLYNYIISPEFKHRIETILETFDEWRQNIDKEKRWFNSKWAKQEKMIERLTLTTVGMHGDFQGITNNALLQLKDEDIGVEKISKEDELDVI